MKRKSFILTTIASGMAVTAERLIGLLDTDGQRDYYQLIRHATLLLNIGGVKFLIDPMLSQKGSMDPVANAGNDIRIPMLELPFDRRELFQLLTTVDAVLLTHLHRDHWDEDAKRLIPKDKPIYCQPGDELHIRNSGFLNVNTVESKAEFKGVEIFRTGGQHGKGAIGEKMGLVSGFVLVNGKSTIYIAGDTIYCDQVKDALDRFSPNEIIVNAGAAQFLSGGPITMDLADLLQVMKVMPDKSRLSAVHMDTVNHCLLTRTKLRELVKIGNAKAITIPEDGEVIYL
jgi:L-ascorbate metabolism protein UlaG (beta-lactamase superfamily)